MGRKEHIIYSWSGKFEKGLVTALERSQLAVEALAEGTLGVYPYKHGWLAPFPKPELFFDPKVGRDGYQGTNCKVVGSFVWRPHPGRDIMIFAVHGDWPQAGGVTGTMIFHFVDPADSGKYQGEFSAEYLTFVRGDAPVRFTQFPMTYYDEAGEIYHPRSNWLVIATPHDYTQLIEYHDDLSLGNEYKIWLPYIFSDVKVYKSRLIGINEVDNEVYYSEPYDVSLFSHFKIGEEYGPNVGLLEALDAIYVLKPDSIWKFAGDTPVQWTRKIRVLSNRGTCFPIPADPRFGMIMCDQQGIYLSTGYPEQVDEISTQIPELTAMPDDLVQFYDRKKIDHSSQFAQGTHNSTDVENWGTEEYRIHVLTLDHPATSEQDQQIATTGHHVIGPSEVVWQTFKLTTDAYWSTGISVRLQRDTIDSEVTVELVEFDGADPNNPDREEILFIDVISVGGLAWYFSEFDLPIFLKPTNVSENLNQYMIRITGLTNDTRWLENNLDPYASGESSWDSGADALFKVWGYQYYQNGTWTSPWYDCEDVKRWGALVSQFLFPVNDPDWETKVSLRYKFRSGGWETSWQTFPLGTTGYPAGGALTNIFAGSSGYDEIKFEVTLDKVASEIPPFIDLFLITYSTMIEDMFYPCGLVHEERMYLAGIDPDKTVVTVRSPEGGYFQDKDSDRLRYLSHFVVWRGGLYAGSILEGDGCIKRIRLDTEPDCVFGEGELVLYTGARGSEDPRAKQMFTLKLVWIEATYGGTKGAWVIVQVYADNIPEVYNLDQYTKNTRTRQLGDGRVEKTCTLTFPGAIMQEITIGVAAFRYTPAGEDPESSKPWFEMKQITADLIAWPIPKGPG